MCIEMAELRIILTTGHELPFSVYRNSIIEDENSGVLTFTVVGEEGVDHYVTIFRRQMLGYAISHS